MPIDRSLNELTLPELFARFEATGLVRRLLELARDEDLGAWKGEASAWGKGDQRETGRNKAGGSGGRGGSGDITSDCSIDPGRMGVGQVVARRGGVISGLAAMPMLLEIFAPACRGEVWGRDGEQVMAGTVLASVRGPLDEILGLERTLLNLVGRLSGVATRTAEFVRKIPAGSRAKLYDTRKTTPGMRLLEKYAVRCGGGFCHRIGLHDAVLLKDNHLTGTTPQTIGAFVERAAARAREMSTPGFVQVEVDTIEQFEGVLALKAGVVDIVLLDNMTCEEMSYASQRRNTLNPGLELEASGGVDLTTIGMIAGTGVDRISVGGLTHSAVSLDVALDVE